MAGEEIRDCVLTVPSYFTYFERNALLSAAKIIDLNVISLIDENTAAFMGPDGDLEVVGRGTVTVVDPAGLEHSSMSYVRKAQAVTLIGLKLHILAAGAHFNVETREARLA